MELAKSLTSCIVFCCLPWLQIPANAQSTDKSDAEQLVVQSTGSNQKEGSISDAEAEQFAKDWVAALSSANRVEANELFAIKEVVNRSIAPIRLSKNDRRGAIDGSMDGLKTIIASLFEIFGNGASYELVSVKRRDGDPFVLFRLVNADGALNYHLLRVKRIRGGVRADRLSFGITGESLCASMRQNFKRMSTMYSKSKQEQEKFIEHLQTFKHLGLAAGKGEMNRALDLFKQLPEDLQAEKLAQLYRVMAHQYGDEADFEKVLDEFIKSFPDDPSLAMVLLDSASLKGDSEMLLKAHSMLSEWSGGDPYLDLMVAAGLAEMGETEKAVKMTEAIDPTPINVLYAHTFKIGVALASEDFDCVLEQLLYMQDNFKVEFDDLRSVEGYEGFVKSPQFKEWIDESKAEKPKTESK